MSFKHGLTGALLAALCGTPLVSAQNPMLLPPVREGAVAAESAIAPLPPEAAILGAVDAEAAGHHPNKGLTATCCGPVGGNGPINEQIYFRYGANFIISDTAFGRSLKTGYEFQGGGRTLFFRPDRTGAFAVDVNLNYSYNDGRPESVFDFNGAAVTVRGLNRTSVGLGLGYDWFLLGPGSTGCDGRNLRVGFDLGARWGTSSLDMNFADVPDGYLRSQDVYGAGVAGIHADLVVPVGAWNFLTGIRGQWTYSGPSLIPGTNTGVHDLGVLLTLGVQW